jgi:hypothetical protein
MMAAQEISLDVPKTVTIRIDQPKAASPILGSFLLLLAGLVGWAAATFLDYEDNVMAKADYQLSLSNDLKSILIFIEKKDYCLATALLDDNQVAAGMVGAPKSSAVIVLSNRIASPDLDASAQLCGTTANDPVAQGTRVSLSREQVQSDLFSSERRKFAEQYVASYNAGSEQTKSEIVSALIAAIIGGEDDVHRYRVNIYIALTFSLLPKAALTAEQQQKLKALQQTAEYKQDPQFRINVDRAIKVQVG